MRRLIPLLALFAAGCVVGPNYRAPQGLSAAKFRTGSSGAPPDAAWWRAFNDPALDALEARALAQNLDIAAAVARVLQSRAAAGAANAALEPEGSTALDVARARQSLEGPNGPIVKYFPPYPRTSSLYDVTAGASWELDLFGGLRRQSEAARADLAAADAGLWGARLTVAAETADAYLSWMGDETRLRLARRQVEVENRLRGLASIRFDAGQAPRRDVDQAEALTAAAAAAQALLVSAVDAQRNRLRVLCGATPETDLPELVSDPDAARAAPTAPNFAAGSPPDLMRRRPDLIAAERRLGAANARIGAAVADYYPKISLQGLLGYQATGAAGGVFLSGAAQEAQGAFGVRWRLFDFGRVDAEVAAAKGRQAEALADYRSAVLRAAEDVENALTAQLQRAAAAHELHHSADALQRARTAADDAYAAGQLSLLEVVDADRQLLQTQDQAAQADADVARAAVALVRALGGGAGAGERPTDLQGRPAAP